jgi:isoleucyl-tRNA synthetase
MDRWILSRVGDVTEVVTRALDGYEPLGATEAIAKLIDDLSNWYVRRCRRRFWRTDPNAPASDSLAAQATLLDVLQQLTFLLAPFCPFVADRLFHELFDVASSDSIHLRDWPTSEAFNRDEDLEAAMDVARSLTSLGRAARADAGVKVRQPLHRALVFLPTGSPRPPEGVVEEELNVDVLEFSSELADVLTFELVPNFRTLGPRLGEAVKELKPALAALDSVATAQALEQGQTVSIYLSNGEVILTSDDLDLRVQSQGGFAVSRAGGEVVALDLAIDDGLLRRGYLRDVVRQVQDLRKNSGFDVSDRITLHLVGVDDLSDGFSLLANEVLAIEIVTTPGPGEGVALDLDDERQARAWATKN